MQPFPIINFHLISVLIMRWKVEDLQVPAQTPRPCLLANWCLPYMSIWSCLIRVRLFTHLTQRWGTCGHSDTVEPHHCPCFLRLMGVGIQHHLNGCRFPNSEQMQHCLLWLAGVLDSIRLGSFPSVLPEILLSGYAKDWTWDLLHHKGPLRIWALHLMLFLNCVAKACTNI